MAELLNALLHRATTKTSTDRVLLLHKVQALNSLEPAHTKSAMTVIKIRIKQGMIQPSHAQQAAARRNALLFVIERILTLQLALVNILAEVKRTKHSLVLFGELSPPARRLER